MGASSITFVVAHPLQGYCHSASSRGRGIEIVPAMVDRLREKISAQQLPVVVGDMTTAPVTREFSRVFLVFNGISNLPTQAEQVECFRNAARHLRPGGCFVVELWVPELPKHAPYPQAIVGRSEDG